MILTLVCNHAPGALLLLAWLFFSLVEHSIHKCSIFYSMLYSRYLFEHIILGRGPIDFDRPIQHFLVATNSDSGEYTC